MTGYKHCYCKILSSGDAALIVQKNLLEISKSERIPLKNAIVDFS